MNFEPIKVPTEHRHEALQHLTLPEEPNLSFTDFVKDSVVQIRAAFGKYYIRPIQKILKSKRFYGFIVWACVNFLIYLGVCGHQYETSYPKIQFTLDPLYHFWLTVVLIILNITLGALIKALNMK